MSHKRRIQTNVTKMKTLKQHINEALKIGNNLSDWSSYSCQPTTKDELIEIIRDRISKEGYDCDLNDIDTSLITDMSYLFGQSPFNGDISKWDVSNVKYTHSMFAMSSFNRDISKWNVSNAVNMGRMFSNSKFNRDISKWKINKDCDTTNMFKDCPIKDEYKPVLPE